MELENQAADEKKRAAFFVDGFNLYHAIDNLGKPYLKWISYWALASILIPKRSEKLVGVTWCTARHPQSQDKAHRHQMLVAAQEYAGVTVRQGHFISEDRECRNCNTKWQHLSEKEGDINVAISLLCGAFLNEFDHAYLVTADSDQVPTVRMFRQQFPEKLLTVVVPPNRKRSEHLHNASNGYSLQMNEAHLDRAVMRPIIMKEGLRTIVMPKEYAPPAGWVHPDDRPGSAAATGVNALS